MKKVLDRVVRLLETRPELRDDVNLTLKAIWDDDLKKQGASLSNILASTLLCLLQQGKITKFETVRRMWQLSQQHNQHLRGSSYDIRHRQSEPEAKQEIKTLNHEIAHENKIVEKAKKNKLHSEKQFNRDLTFDF